MIFFYTVMEERKLEKSKKKKLMGYIASQYSKEEIDWYLSLVPEPTTEKEVEIKISSNSYADEK